MLIENSPYGISVMLGTYFKYLFSCFSFLILLLGRAFTYVFYHSIYLIIVSYIGTNRLPCVEKFPPKIFRYNLLNLINFSNYGIFIHKRIIN